MQWKRLSFTGLIFGFSEILKNPPNSFLFLFLRHTKRKKIKKKNKNLLAFFVFTCLFTCITIKKLNRQTTDRKKISLIHKHKQTRTWWCSLFMISRWHQFEISRCFTQYLFNFSQSTFNGIVSNFNGIYFSKNGLASFFPCLTREITYIHHMVNEQIIDRNIPHFV